RSLRPSRSRRSTATLPLLSPRRYSSLNFQTLPVFGSSVASKERLRLVVAVWPRLSARPKPTLPDHPGGGSGGAAGGGGVCARASPTVAIHVLITRNPTRPAVPVAPFMIRRSCPVPHACTNRAVVHSPPP